MCILLIILFLPVAAAAYEVGDPVEDFTLPDLYTGDGSLYDHVGDIVILNFFTTWCPGCNEEADHLENDVWAVYRDRGLTVLAVDIQELAPLVQGWAAAREVTYPILLAPDWTIIDQFPGAFGLPYNAVLDRSLVIRYGSTGFDLAAVTGMVEVILEEDQVPVEEASWGGVKALFR